MLLTVAAGGALAIWLYLLLARGGFWRMRDSELAGTVPAPAPSVAVVIPARNEAEVIGRAVASVAGQEYPGTLHIVVVDDNSCDGTAEVARAAGGEGLTVIQAGPLPSGWTGKLWAVSQGIHEARKVSPDYLLLTDADITHPSGNVSTLVAQAVQGYDLASLMVRLRCESLAERALIPAFVFFFYMLYPPAWIRNSRRRTAGAAGGCMLIRRDTLERIGGIDRIHAELIDDCALARAVKQEGGRVWLGLSSTSVSLRKYQSFTEIEGMISRTAFTQLRYSWLLLAGTAAGLILTYLIPPAATAAGSLLGACAWLVMSVAYVPALRFYRRSILWAPALPLIALFYLAATVHSAVAYARGRGGLWKGRAQAGSAR